jgi:hypothetical protein
MVQLIEARAPDLGGFTHVSVIAWAGLTDGSQGKEHPLREGDLSMACERSLGLAGPGRRRDESAL